MKRLFGAAAAAFLAVSPAVLAQDGKPVSDADAPARGAAEGPLEKTQIFEGKHAYFRIREVAPGLAADLKTAWEGLAAENKIKGVVIDLRFAGGTDYAAAAAAADLFYSEEELLLKAGDGEHRSTKKQDAIALPAAVLVNKETSGAAEALAAMIRQQGPALVIGFQTAGAAKDVEVPGSPALGESGILPDLTAKLPAEEERAYLEDPYRIARLGSLDSDAPAVTTTNRAPRRRVNEADLVRFRREGVDVNGPVIPDDSDNSPTVRVVTDPALARGLDFLKGAVLFNLKSGS